MDEPDTTLRADSEERSDAPDFDALVSLDELVSGDRTRDDFFDAVLQLDDPATVEEVAKLADHGRDAAREYLEWFVRMGIVKQVGDSPATYRLNREYLTWRRVQRIRDEHDPEELIKHFEVETKRERDFASQFGVERPGQVRLSEYTETTDTSIEDAWMQLSAWRTTRRRITLLERALATTDEPHTDQHRRVA